MKKSVRIHLLVITTVVAIFAFAGIWYLRPGVPNELIEQARARQLQPLLEIDAPMRKPKVESLVKSSVDIKALEQEMLPTLTEQVSRLLEVPLYEKLKAQLLLDESFSSKLSSNLLKSLNVESQTIPQGLQAQFTQQVDALRSELLLVVGEGQSSFFYQIEGMLDARLDRFEEDFTKEIEAYVPQLVDRMIPTLVTMLVAELDMNKEAYLPLLAKELQPYGVDTVSEEELLALYGTYREQLVMDLVPSILTAMEDPARAEVSEMVKSVILTAPVPSPPTMTSLVTTVPSAPLTPTPVASPFPPPVTSRVEMDVPSEATITLKSVVPSPPVMKPASSRFAKPEPILTAPSFTPEGPELFIDPITYEQKRTEIRTKAIQEVLERINAQ